jgi:hypothetical protein
MLSGDAISNYVDGISDLLTDLDILNHSREEVRFLLGNNMLGVNPKVFDALILMVRAHKKMRELLDPRR